MELLNSLFTGAAGGTDNLVLTNWRQGMQATGLRLRGRLPIAIGAGGTPTLTDLYNVVAYFLGSFTLRYGPNQEILAYDGVPGNELMNVYRAVFQDVPYNDLGTVGTSFVGNAQTTGNKTLTVDVEVPFVHPQHYGTQRRPGWTQGRSMRLELVEGATLTPGSLTITRQSAVNAQWDVIPLYRPGEDQWSPILAYRRINSQRLDAVGPPGVPVAVWDDNAAGISTSITKFRLFVGANEVHSNIVPANIWAEWLSYIDQGGSDMFLTHGTPLYVTDPTEDVDELPHGPITITLNNQDVAQLKIRILYYPDLGETAHDSALEYVARTKGRSINASVADPSNTDSDFGSASTRPVKLIDSSDARFYQRSGMHVHANGTKQAHLSPTDVAGIAAASAVSQKAGAGDTAAQLGAKRTLLKVPGAVGWDGHSRGGETRKAGVKGFVGSFTK